MGQISVSGRSVSDREALEPADAKRNIIPPVSSSPFSELAPGRGPPFAGATELTAFDSFGASTAEPATNGLSPLPIITQKTFIRRFLRRRVPLERLPQREFDFLEGVPKRRKYGVTSCA